MNLLFICTHNRCRSILCEALANHLAQGRFKARSAGSQPAGAVHPETLAQLAARGIETQNLHSKSWETIEDFTPDVVITVCDSAASEACPIWLGRAQKVHWGLPDPSKETESPSMQRAFEQVIATIEGRILRLLRAQPARDAAELARQMRDIGGEA